MILGQGPSVAGFNPIATAQTEGTTPATFPVLTLAPNSAWAGDIHVTGKATIPTPATASVWTGLSSDMPASASVTIGGVVIAFPTLDYADAGAWLAGCAAQPGIASVTPTPSSIVFTATAGANVTTVTNLIINATPVALVEDPVGQNAGSTVTMIAFDLNNVLAKCDGDGNVAASSSSTPNVSIGGTELDTAECILTTGTNGALNVIATGVSAVTVDWSAFAGGQVVFTAL